MKIQQLGSGIRGQGGEKEQLEPGVKGQEGGKKVRGKLRPHSQLQTVHEEYYSSLAST